MSDQDYDARRKEVNDKVAEWQDRIKEINYFLSFYKDQIDASELKESVEDMLGAYENHSNGTDLLEGNLREVTEQWLEREIRYTRNLNPVCRAKHLVELFQNVLKDVHMTDLMILKQDEDTAKGQYSSRG